MMRIAASARPASAAVQPLSLRCRRIGGELAADAAQNACCR